MKPMNLQTSLLFFGLPGLIIFLMFTFCYTLLINQGLSVWWTTYICIWGPLILLVITVMVFYLKDNLRFKEYFWVNNLERKEVLIVLIGFIAVQAGEALLGFTRPIIASLPGFQIPVYYPDLFQANIEFKIPMQSLLGIPLKGNAFAFVFFTIWLFTNIFCEELLWRGYALPRMELYFGKWAWLVNGLLWNVSIHFFFRFSFITLLPISLILPYLSQKYKSLWPGVIIHGLGNLLLFVVIIPGYFQ